MLRHSYSDSFTSGLLQFTRERKGLAFKDGIGLCGVGVVGRYKSAVLRGIY